MSDRLQIVMTLVLGGMVIIMAILTPFIGNFRTTRPRALVFVGCSLVVLGSIGGFGCILSSFGGLNWLPQSWEWPVGSSDGVITMPDGTHVVPHVAAGRVQVYDAHWKFLRGWAIGASGSDFKVIPTGPDKFDVFPRRSLAHDTYRLSGEVVARRTRPPGRYTGLPYMGQRHSFPTAPWHLVFVGSFPSWLTTALGIGVLIFLKAREARAQTELQRV